MKNFATWNNLALEGQSITVLIYILWLKGWAVQKIIWYTRYKKLFTKTMEFNVAFVRPVWLCQCKHTKERTCFKSTFFTLNIIDDIWFIRCNPQSLTCLQILNVFKKFAVCFDLLKKDKKVSIIVFFY